MGRGELRMVRLVGFLELSKAGGWGWDMSVWLRGVSNEGCEQRQGHQQPGESDQTGISVRKRVC